MVLWVQLVQWLRLVRWALEVPVILGILGLQVRHLVRATLAGRSIQSVPVDRLILMVRLVLEVLWALLRRGHHFVREHHLVLVSLVGRVILRVRLVLVDLMGLGVPIRRMVPGGLVCRLALSMFLQLLCRYSSWLCLDNSRRLYRECCWVKYFQSTTLLRYSWAIGLLLPILDLLWLRL